MYYAFFLPLVLFLFFCNSVSYAIQPSLALKQKSLALEIKALAVVGKHVITSRELALHTYLNRQLGAKDLNRGLQELVAQWAIKLEADSFLISTESAPNPALQKLFDKAKSGLKKDASIKDFEFSDSEVLAALERRNQVENFLKLKSDTRSVVVTEEEVKLEFEKNRAKLGLNKSYNDFREQIRESIARDRARGQMNEWVELIQRKYSVRILNQIEVN